MSDDEVNQRAQLDPELGVAHEVPAEDLLDDTTFGRHVLFMSFQLLEKMRRVSHASDKCLFISIVEFSFVPFLKLPIIKLFPYFLVFFVRDDRATILSGEGESGSLVLEL